MLGSSIVLTAGVAVSGGLALVFHLLAARGLGPVGYGVLMASLAYAVLWAIVMEGGISVALTIPKPSMTATQAAARPSWALEGI